MNSTKTQVLLVSDVFYFPPYMTGNTENIYNLLWQLKRNGGYEVDFLFVGDISKIAPTRIVELSKIVDKIYLRNLKYSKLIRLTKWIYNKNFDLKAEYSIVFFATFLSAYTRFNFKFKAKYILYQADSRTLYFSKLPGVKNFLRYIKYRIEQQLLFQLFDKIIFVSEIDEYEVNSYLKLNNKTLTIPVGCNLLGAVDKKEGEDIDLIFTGNFGFLPNSDAAIYFVNNILPKLIVYYPEVKIFFVGRNPTHEMIKKMKKYPQNLIITGEVDDINRFMKRAKIYISPLFLGSGMKNKILHAMLNSLPIIASIESTAGFINKDNFLIAKSDEEWLKYINYLLRDEGARDKLGATNLKIVSENFSFEYIANNYFIPLFKSVDEI